MQGSLLVLRLSQNLDPRPAVDALQDFEVGFEALVLLLELENGRSLLADLVLQRLPRFDDQFLGQIDAGGGDCHQHHGGDKRPNGEMTASAHISAAIGDARRHRFHLDRRPPRSAATKG